jgi:hypothetical protein
MEEYRYNNVNKVQNNKSSGSIFGSFGRSSSKKQSAKAQHGGSKQGGPVRPPPGFHSSYQIPNGHPNPPSDNIDSYDSRWYSNFSSMGRQSENGHYHAKYQRQSSGGSHNQWTGEEEAEARLAGVHPSHLQNGGRPFASHLDPSAQVKMRRTPNQLDNSKRNAVYVTKQTHQTLPILSSSDRYHQATEQQTFRDNHGALGSLPIYPKLKLPTNSKNRVLVPTITPDQCLIFRNQWRVAPIKSVVPTKNPPIKYLPYRT